MGSQRLLLILAAALVAFGLYTLRRSQRARRAAGGAWYAVEGRQLRSAAQGLGLQAAILLLAGCVLAIGVLWASPKDGESEPPPTATPTPTLQSSAPAPTTGVQESPTAAATPGPTAAAPSSPTPATGDEPPLVEIPTPFLGTEAVVANTDGLGLWLRDAPFGNNLVLLPEDSVLIVRGGLLEVDGVLWQKVIDADGREGWVAAEYLAYR